MLDWSFIDFNCHRICGQTKYVFYTGPIFYFIYAFVIVKWITILIVYAYTLRVGGVKSYHLK